MDFVNERGTAVDEACVELNQASASVEAAQGLVSVEDPTHGHDWQTGVFDNEGEDFH
jgi:hypothetical protein